ncbi:MAG: efflux RND transporter periplasmic adaptor subunit [Magnetococcales bacterium]|nr:efflux RND transporter periplasmic adaptor subunit [Magnetococcales bacterium]NGZ26526.1 efflux RND transporter periplasmic adaptor subunit [Magnetococcales bacterium]
MKFKVYSTAISRLAGCLLLVWSSGGMAAPEVKKTPPPNLDLSIPGRDAPQGRALVVSRLETTLASQIPAVIQSITVDHGNRFEAGQVLVILDCQVLQAELTKAKMELEAEEQTDQANRKLREYKSISELEVAVSASKVKRAKAQVNLAAAKAAMCQIKAPFAGRVVKRKVNPYQFVGEGTPLLEVLDDVNLRIQLVASSSWISWLKPGLEFAVTIDETGKKYPAVVETLGSRIDPASQTFEVWAVLPGQHPELLSGMSGTVQFNRP